MDDGQGQQGNRARCTREYSSSGPDRPWGESDPLSAIPGLRYVAAYLAPEEQRELPDDIDQQPWLGDLRRRVQQYGYRYDYTRRTMDDVYLGPLPGWLLPLAGRLESEGLASNVSNQVIVNEYQPGQGIASHTDSVPSFGDTIVSISLGSPCAMIFTKGSGSDSVSLLLEPGSALVMQRAARYEWQHSIPKRLNDVVDGRRYRRARRVSLTFRTVIR